MGNMTSDDHKKEIGRLCMAFQNLESVICFLTWTLIGECQQVGQIVTSNMSFSRVCDTLVGLSVYRFGEDTDTTKSIAALVKQASQLEQKRNRFIHSYWTIDKSLRSP